MARTDGRAADALLAPTRAHALATARVCGLPQPPVVVRNGRAPSEAPVGTYSRRARSPRSRPCFARLFENVARRSCPHVW